MKIATWNVNSIKPRLKHLTDWLIMHRPEVVLLQELKCEEDKFPYMEIEEAGYNIAVNGQKSWNGVAVLSKFLIEDVLKGLPGNDNDNQARYIEAVIPANDEVIRVASVYVPNGGEVGSEKWQYKLEFLERLRAHSAKLLDFDEKLVIGGDYNVAPKAADVFDPAGLDGTTCFHEKERGALNSMFNLGFVDCFRAVNPDKQQFSWWDYRGGGFQYNKGMRIDHLLISPEAANAVSTCEIDERERGKSKASDHAPVWCEVG